MSRGSPFGITRLAETIIIYYECEGRTENLSRESPTASRGLQRLYESIMNVTVG